jgi:hypothetical protein
VSDRRPCGARWCFSTLSAIVVGVPVADRLPPPRAAVVGRVGCGADSSCCTPFITLPNRLAVEVVAAALLLLLLLLLLLPCASVVKAVAATAVEMAAEGAASMVAEGTPMLESTRPSIDVAPPIMLKPGPPTLYPATPKHDAVAVG